jgi:hypothetical protein
MKCAHQSTRDDCPSCIADGVLRSPAYQIAEKACKEHLIWIYGDEEGGIKQVGVRTFHKWVSRVEAALESENPET